MAVSPARPPAVVAAVAIALTVAAALTGVLPRIAVTAARADEVTASQNNLRTGWDQHEPGLAPASDGGPVGGSSFGQLFETHLNGQIFGQPIVVGQVLIVVTETNHVYGLDATTGAIKWSDYLGPAEPWTAIGCNDVAPEIGITSTPVYDPATKAVYLTAVVSNGPTPSQPHVYAYAVRTTNGAVLRGWPVAIHGSPVNEPGTSFDPFTERQRPGLLLLGGRIYMAFGSYCDYQPYAGYVAGVDVSTRRLTLWSDEAGLTDIQGGIWQSGGGLMSDGTGRIFVATGNGVSPPPGAGTKPPLELGDSVVRLSVGANGSLSAADFFSPADAPTLDANDLDFGSGGPIGLPFGTKNFPGLLVQAGKDGTVYLLNRNNLGGRDQGAGGTDDMVSKTGPFGGLFGHPAAFGPQASVSAASSGDYVYYVGNDDVMRYLQFGVDSSGTPVLTDVANSSTTFGYSSGSPVVTSNGADPASAVVWEVYAADVTGAQGSLQAFDAVPPSGCTAPCTMSPIWSAPLGTVSQFSVPATNDGRVYVGTRDGNVFAFGSPDAAPLTGSPVNFGQAGVAGKGAHATVTLTAASAVTVSRVSAAEPAGEHAFSVGTASVNGRAARFPAELSPGETLTVPVTFTPALAGGVTGALQVATNAANFPTVSVGLTGQGTAPGLQASPAALSFKPTPDKTIVTRTVLVTNGSTGTEKISATRRAGAPFAARLPASGMTLAPGQTVSVSVSYRPLTTGISTSSFSITTSGGHVLTVKLAGTGKTAISRVTASRAAINFGLARLGTRAARTIVITNSGDLPAVMTRATGLTVPFALQAVAPAGLPLIPRYKLSIPVSFTPASTGVVRSQLTLHWRDAEGFHAVTVSLTGTGVAAAAGRAAVPSPGGGWTLNGSAAVTGEQLALTGGKPEQEGSAVYPVPEPSNGLKVSFTATLGGDGGMTLSLLDAGQAGVSSLGGSGGQLGFGGLPGVAVVLDTGKFAGDPSGNFAGIATGASGAGLKFADTTSKVPELGQGSHLIGVTVRGRRIRVSIDGKQVLSAQLGANVIPPAVLVAFTGATGSLAGSQTAGSAAVTAAGRRLPAPGGGWSFNGTAAMSGSSALLTRRLDSEAGSVVYPTAVPTDGLKVTFTAQIYGGTGATGLSFALLNPSDSSSTSLGGSGGSQGVGGLDGMAVVLNTVKQDQYSNGNMVQIAESGTGGLSILNEAEGIPPLRPGPNTVTIAISSVAGSAIMTVWLDGGQILRQAVPTLTATALLAFTGATGARTDFHLVRDVAISAAR